MRLTHEIVGIPPGYQYDGAAKQNGELPFFLPRNIVGNVRGGAQFIVKREDYGGRQYTGAMIENIGMRQTGTYYVDVDASWTGNSSCWIGFWLFDERNRAEIDVLESIDDIGPTFNAHGAGRKIGPMSHRRGNDTFRHTYGVRVEPGRITFYMDGEISGVCTDAAIVEFIRNSGCFPKWQNSVGGSWAGQPDATSRFPHVVTFHRTRFYKP